MGGKGWAVDSLENGSSSCFPSTSLSHQNSRAAADYVALDLQEPALVDIYTHGTNWSFPHSVLAAGGSSMTPNMHIYHRLLGVAFFFSLARDEDCMPSLSHAHMLPALLCTHQGGGGLSKTRTKCRGSRSEYPLRVFSGDTRRERGTGCTGAGWAETRQTGNEIPKTRQDGAPPRTLVGGWLETLGRPSARGVEKGGETTRKRERERQTEKKSHLKQR